MTDAKWGEDFKIQGWAEPVFGAQIPVPEEGYFTLRVHRKDDCLGPNCVIHNPSNHPLKDAPLNWRGDRGLMERICEHGYGHPDPDDIAFQATVHGEDEAAAQAIHGCDGCC